MTSYQSRNQIQSELQNLLPHQIRECKKCDKLPQALEELIKHNYQATFVCYDKRTCTIEVGVEEEEAVDSYPEIIVHKFRLDEVGSQVRKTFRNSDPDLQFYGRLLAGHGRTSRMDEVVLV